MAGIEEGVEGGRGEGGRGERVEEKEWRRRDIHMLTGNIVLTFH